MRAGLNAGLLGSSSLTSLASPGGSPGLSPLNLLVPPRSTTLPFRLDYLLVAGGGGGGSAHPGGGGGGGGVLQGSILVTSPIYSHLINVGAAGGGGANGGTGSSGGNTTFNGMTALGGGGGGGGGNAGTHADATVGAAGGCGGGGSSGPGDLAGGAGTLGQGYAGATGKFYSGSAYTGSGGGGAGGVGQIAIVGKGGDGGPGLISSISGVPTMYGCGGGGGYDNGAAGFGGLAGDGTNAGSNASASGARGIGPGSGGAGPGNTGGGGAGLAGIAILRYPKGSAVVVGGTYSEVWEGGVLYGINTFSPAGQYYVNVYPNNQQYGALSFDMTSGQGSQLILTNSPGLITLETNNVVTGGTNAYRNVETVNFQRSSGRYYFEVLLILRTTPGFPEWGVGNTGALGGGELLASPNAIGTDGQQIYSNGINTGFALSGTGIIGAWHRVAVDLNTNKIWFKGPQDAFWNGSSSSDPTAGTGGATIPAGGNMAPIACLYNGNTPPYHKLGFNFGDPNVPWQGGGPPPGYKGWADIT